MTGPSVFGLPHLSEDAVAAFADGVLSPAATARARRHCAECAECAEAVRGQREAAMMLRTAGAPALPAGLLDRLAGLPMSAQLPPPLSGLPITIDSDGVPVFVAYQPDLAGRTPEQDRSDPAGFRAARIEPARPAHRRVLLPVSILASAAAVVAAGAIGGTVGSMQPAVNQPAAVNQAPVLVAGQLDTGSDPASTDLPLTSAGSAGSVVQPVTLRSGFRTARLDSTP
jgi:hypothetical protein